MTVRSREASTRHIAGHHGIARAFSTMRTRPSAVHGLPRARRLHSGESRALQLSLQPRLQRPGRRECEACAAGTFKEAAGAAPCVACGAGKYLNTTVRAVRRRPSLVAHVGACLRLPSAENFSFR
jgi:hypothetical protein